MESAAGISTLIARQFHIPGLQKNRRSEVDNINLHENIQGQSQPGVEISSFLHSLPMFDIVGETGNRSWNFFAYRLSLPHTWPTKHRKSEVDIFNLHENIQGQSARRRNFVISA